MLFPRRSFFAFTALAVLLLWSLPSGTWAAQLTTRSMPSQEQSQVADSHEVSDLLNQAKSQANRLKMDASEMESFTRSNLDWQTEVNKINQIKSDVNVVGRIVTKLKEEQTMASEWQKTAIARITPLLQELASNTTAVIDHLNKDQGRNLKSEEHRDMLKMNADLASDLSSVIGDFVEYGKTKSRFHQLRQKLELSEPAG